MSDIISENISENISKKNKRDYKEFCVWDHFNKESIGGEYYSAKCSYYFEKWTRRRPDKLKSHLALYCNNISQDIKLEYLELLVTDNSNKKIKKNENNFAKAVFKKCQMLISFFKNSYRTGTALQEDIINSFIKELEQLETILTLSKKIIQVVENKSSNMALYKVFREICLHVMKIWKNFSGNTNSCKILLTQLRKYSEKTELYDMEYIEDHDIPEIWWTTYLNFYDNNETETDLFSNQQQLENEEDLNIDLETILAEEFQN
ncbi:157_t:CDS:2 [Cetraspora pellucida]|uniref:157_t:CDS:1 n=1 Tax=Cetraspora pellucida TaxID=1433469 RepID=A0A9N9C745_9GLOM|nr:157_t:CDS:2 [Cetraspora pellucida]